MPVDPVGFWGAPTASIDWCEQNYARPETLTDWLAAEPLWLPAAKAKGKPNSQSQRPSTLRSRLRALPALDEEGLRAAQVTAIRNLEVSLANDRPRALIQMATGAGKTTCAVASIYRLVKFGGAKRVVFLVDRGNLGRQTLKEFQQLASKRCNPAPSWAKSESDARSRPPVSSCCRSM